MGICVAGAVIAGIASSVASPIGCLKFVMYKTANMIIPAVMAIILISHSQTIAIIAMSAFCRS